MLATRLWQLSEAGEPAYFLGRLVDPPDAELFERLLGRGVLRHAGYQTSWDVCDGCDCGRDDRPVRQINGVTVAVCIADRHRDQVLLLNDLVTFELSIPGLVAVAAEMSGLSTTPEQVALGVWRLGSPGDGPVVYIVPTRETISQPHLLAVVRHIDPSRELLLLGPPLDHVRRADLVAGGLHHVPLAERIGTDVKRPLALDLTKPTKSTGVPPRLQLSRSTFVVKFDGRVTEMPCRKFELLLLLADRLRAGRPLVTSAEIMTAMFSKATSDARVRGLVRELRTHLQTHLQAPSDFIQTRTNLGYCIALSAQEVAIGQ